MVFPPNCAWRSAFNIGSASCRGARRCRVAEYGPIVLVGGYGVVGSQIAELFSRRNPTCRLVLAGRSLENANAAAFRLPNAQGAKVDIHAKDPLHELQTAPALVVSVVNDPSNSLLRAALRRDAAYIDIARWTQRLIPALIDAAALSPRAPAIFASSWMGGAPGLFAAHIASELTSVDDIRLDILYALRDRAGPNSIEYADQLTVPFQVLENGRWNVVQPLSSPRRVIFSGARRRETRRFCTPDLEILPRVTGARGVDVRIGYDDPSAASAIAFLVRSGIWRAISGPRFEKLRRSMLYHPGNGETHEVRIEIDGLAGDGARTSLRGDIIDPLGQTHMTAAAAVVQMERALGLNGAIAPPAGIHFAETHQQPSIAINALQDMGLRLGREPALRG